MRVVAKHALQRNDPARMPLPRPIDDPHAAAADFAEDFVIAETPLLIRHIRVVEDLLEGLFTVLACVTDAFEQHTTHAAAARDARRRATLWTRERCVTDAQNRLWRKRQADHAYVPAASAAHRCRISSSMSAGF